MSGISALILAAPAWAQKTQDGSTSNDSSASAGSPTSAGGPGTNLCDGCEGGGEGGGPHPAGDIVPPQIYTTTPGGLNVAEGSFTYSHTDLALGSISLERHFDGVAIDPDVPGNNHDPESFPFGTHTSNNFDIYVSSAKVLANTTPGTITYPEHWHTVVHLGSGASGTYWQSNMTSTGNIIGDDMEAEKAELHMSGGAYVYTDQSGVVYQFNPAVHVTGTPAGVYPVYSQKIATITYPDGRVRSFSYDAGGRLKLVSDTAGYAVVLDYNGQNLISAACAVDRARTYLTSASTCAGAAMRVLYGYAGPLSEVTGVDNAVTHYTTEPSGLITCIQPPGAAGCQVANSYNVHGVTQTTADGAVWQVHAGVTFSRDSDYIPTDGDNEASVVDPAGKISYYSFTGSTPYNATDANGRTTMYTFIGGSNVFENQNQGVHVGTLLTEVEFPEGNKYLAEYYGPFHSISKQTYRAKPGTGLADTIQTIGYGGFCSGNVPMASCTLPTSRTDAGGNTTDYAYFSHGGIQSVMQPAPAAGGARPLELHSYVQKYAYVLNAGGGLAPSGGPIWMPASVTVCQTAAGSNTPVCDGSAPQLVTTYEYGADGTVDNLLMRGKAVSSGGETRRTCYGYDQWSNQIWQTAPRAGLSACQ